VLAR
jgi:hypothetical protein